MKQGFSLVELSVVLVIVALMAGGIMAGKSLLRASELRAVITEYQRFENATALFHDKYMGMPGDLYNATEYWGAATCPGTAGTGTQTCNGDGDGWMDNGASASQYNETFTFWQHLANADMIDAEYTGMAGSSSSLHAVPGTNVPKSAFPDAGWSMRYVGPGGNATIYEMDYGFATLVFGLPSTTETKKAALTPEEAWNVDRKVDDGLPAKGFVIARYWDDACSTADDGASAKNDLEASYNLTNEDPQCALYFRNFFARVRDR